MKVVSINGLIAFTPLDRSIKDFPKSIQSIEDVELKGVIVFLIVFAIGVIVTKASLVYLRVSKSIVQLEQQK